MRAATSTSGCLASRWGWKQTGCDVRLAAIPTAQVTLFREDGSARVQPQMSVEVDDVDAVHVKALARGIEILHPLTDEPWGVRRFFTRDPNGVVINVLSH
jgi:catechol 2,3-dioxygenase-like lactoylglutathione lyase family enzyme